MSKLSRRSFLKGTAVSALGAAALGMTACSNNTAASGTASSDAASAPASSTPAQQPAAAETGKPGFFTDPRAASLRYCSLPMTMPKCR